MTKMAFRWSLSCLGLGLLACKTDPELMEISSTQAALTASENSERALDGLLDAADFLSDSTSIAQTLSAMGSASQSCDSSGVACLDASTSCPPPETSCSSEALDESDLEESRAELKEQVQSLVKQLRERILIPANLESETSTSATYHLGPEVLCDDDAPVAPGTTGAPAEYDSDCVDWANRMQLRLRLTSPAEGDVDVTVLVGKEQNEPVVFELHQHSLGVQVDLGEALAYSRELGGDTHDFEQLSGVLELQLVENQPRDYALQLNVLSALKAVVQSDGDRVSASLGATSPALELRVDGNANRVLASMDLGALQVLGPLRVFADAFAPDDDVLSSDSLTAPLPAPEPSYHGSVEMFLAGLQGALEYVADGDSLKLSGLGFGDGTSFIKNDGQSLLALDLNAAKGRHMDLLLEPDGDRTKVSISPGFDLRVALAFHHVADQIDGIASSLLDDTWHFWFDGADPVIVTGDDQLRVDSGTLHLESSADPSATLNVAAGQCLAEVETDAAIETSSSDDWRHQLQVSVCQ